MVEFCAVLVNPTKPFTNHHPFLTIEFEVLDHHFNVGLWQSLIGILLDYYMYLYLLSRPQLYELKLKSCFLKVFKLEATKS